MFKPTRGASKLWSILAVLFGSVAICVVAHWERFQGHAVAQQPAAPTSDEPPLRLAFVPRDALLVFASRPSTLLSRPALAPVRDQFEKLSGKEMPFGLVPKDLHELTIAMVLSQQKGGVSPIVVLNLASPDVARRIMADIGPNPQRASFGQNTYVRSESQECFCQIDERTIVYSPNEASLRRSLAAGKAGASTANWVSQWSTVARKDAVAVVNASMLRGIPQVTAELAGALNELTGTRNDRSRREAGPLAYRIGPLWEKSEYAVASLAISDKIELRLITNSATDDEAKEAHSALLTAISVIRVGIATARDNLASAKGLTSPLVLKHLDVFDEVIEKAQIARRDNQIGALIRIDVETTKNLTTALAPAILAAKATGDRNGSLQNLRQIGLAFHNYHDTYKTLPAAIQIGPKNIPHSWRITLLPFIDKGMNLFNEYRQDEPWDSENNKKVLAKMPAIYRCPQDRRDSTNTSYFVFVGPETVFPPNRGSRIADITDGTSNVIMAVESKREVPWTKPEEIPFSSEQPVPKVGNWYAGGFHILLCDGSVRFVSDSLDSQIMQLLIMCQDGQPVNQP